VHALGDKLLGGWVGAPKAARDDYERFVRAVAGLLGGQASAEEVQASVAVVWHALRNAPPPAVMQGWGAAAALQSIRQELADQLGPLDNADIKDVVARAEAIKARPTVL
jgi:hypothetical protein